MATSVRVLNSDGLRRFREFLEQTASGVDAPTPKCILEDQSLTDAAGFNAQIDPSPYGRPFRSAYELGCYLCEVLREADKASISHRHELWNWISLFFFDELCPRQDGARKMAEPAAYFLDSRYSHQRYYRHIVRNAWHLVSVHGDRSKVLLTPGSTNNPVPVAVRTETQMQITATQAYAESEAVVSLAYRLYFDESRDRLKPGSSRKDKGGPRRLVAVLNQLDLTYDLGNIPVDELWKLLPSEFDAYKQDCTGMPTRPRK